MQLRATLNMMSVSKYETGVNQRQAKVYRAQKGRHSFLLASGVRSPYCQIYQCRRDLNRGYYYQKEITHTEV